jgi:hypothetical protein
MAVRNRIGFAIATAVVALVAACGTDDQAIVGNRAGDDAGAGATGTGSDASTQTFTPLSDAGFSPDAFVGCASDTEEATELPLDLYFMIDSSGSMNDLVAPQTSKWSAVVSAMTGFVSDPNSAGIGVGVQYFPLTQAGVPATCTSSAQCGSAGPCLFKVCDLNVFQQIYPCDTSSDCQGAACEPVGECRYDHNAICQMGGGDCVPDPNGFPLGPCDNITTSTCVAGDSCTASDYATSAVPVGLLPGAASTIVASLGAHQPNGNTPTSAALQGAIDEAKSVATANPGHSVVAVLATDGIPDECSTTTAAGIAQIAAAGLSGTPSIKTFTIGVFTPDAIASGTATLNQIAQSGGTQSAFIIASTGNVEAQFAQALSAIRGASLPCQYSIPVPDGGVPDYGMVNVEYTTAAGVTTGLAYVESAARCGTGSGWYYDVDPSMGATPSAIYVCPSTCSTLGSDTNGKIDVVLGCLTIAR